MSGRGVWYYQAVVSGCCSFLSVMPLAIEAKRRLYVAGSRACARQGVLQLNWLLYATGEEQSIWDRTGG